MCKLGYLSEDLVDFPGGGGLKGVYSARVFCANENEFIHACIAYVLSRLSEEFPDYMPLGKGPD